MALLPLIYHYEHSNIYQHKAFLLKIVILLKLFHVYYKGFSMENVRYPVWTCRDPISLILGT